MRHLRSDYDTIVDTSGKIPDDEPVFILRAQDIAAPATWAHEMRRWQAQRGSKVPDTPPECLRTV